MLLRTEQARITARSPGGWPGMPVRTAWTSYRAAPPQPLVLGTLAPAARRQLGHECSYSLYGARTWSDLGDLSPRSMVSVSIPKPTPAKSGPRASRTGRRVRRRLATPLARTHRANAGPAPQKQPIMEDFPCNRRRLRSYSVRVPRSHRTGRSPPTPAPAGRPGSHRSAPRHGSHAHRLRQESRRHPAATRPRPASPPLLRLRRPGLRHQQSPADPQPHHPRPASRRSAPGKAPPARRPRPGLQGAFGPPAPAVLTRAARRQTSRPPAYPGSESVLRQPAHA
jgi:hypothetical protein